ncbi:MAG TPA: hypothetical protein VN222_16840 [Novosphingobium sp.]|nr:hypothetical protein [Novosphingobium sp.]
MSARALLAGLALCLAAPALAAEPAPAPPVSEPPADEPAAFVAGAWDAHAAAAVLDGEYATQAACEAQLQMARALEKSGAPDIDPRLFDMFESARCVEIAGENASAFGIRMIWSLAE